MYIIIKYLLSAVIVVGVSELAKRSPALGGLLASLPLTSYLAILWLYGETGDTARIASLSQSIFWLVLPSLVLFALLAWLLRGGMNFLPSLTIASIAMFAAYGAMGLALRHLSVSL
ncbi:MAG: DUF3147 family protein [Gammaproteobacteria bacterium]